MPVLYAYFYSLHLFSYLSIIIIIIIIIITIIIIIIIIIVVVVVIIIITEMPSEGKGCAEWGNMEGGRWWGGG